MGIGSWLVKSVEDWMTQNGATLALVAIEKTHVAAVSVFTVRSYYTALGTLTVHIWDTGFPLKVSSQATKIEKLCINDAISLYKDELTEKHIYPMDVDMILKEKLSLGTWICYLWEDECVDNVTRDKCKDCSSRTIQMKKSFPSNQRHNLSLAGRRALSCLKLHMTRAAEEPFGFLLMYGLHGEGPRLGELMRSVWKFAEKVAHTIQHCKAITTELSGTDPLREYLLLDSCTTCIDDLWCLKYLGDDSSGGTDNPTIQGPAGNIFVNPRDF